MMSRTAATVAAMKTIVALALAATTVAAVAGAHHEVSNRRAGGGQAFTDSEITEGFFKTAFGAELHLAGAVNRIRKFDGPVRVYVDNRARPNRSREVADVVADIRARVQNLDIAMVASAAEANVVVML